MIKYYHFWIEGCQMNYADARQVAVALERAGYRATDQAEKADVILLETCTVRRSAEDKAYGRLTSLRPIKERRSDLVIAVMGCLVGIKGNRSLQARFPYVDLFMPPSTDGAPLLAYLQQHDALSHEQAALAERYAIQDGDRAFSAYENGQMVSAPVAVVYGCSHACTFCQIPNKRGVERSRPVGDIAREIRALAAQGVKEITLLGQIVDRYGKDVPDGPNLAALLRAIHEVDGIQRIRFLTSHPNWMNDELIETVAELPKVCEHIEVPAQAGDDEVLTRMKRGYTADDYRRLIERIRERIPNVSIATDIIVGFPGESEAQFQRTCDLLAELRLDVAHIAKYSPRPQTVAERTLPDDVPPEEKERRRKTLDDLQAQMVSEINSRYLGQTVEVLVESDHKGKWRGRTRTNKLVFFEDSREWQGETAEVTIKWTGPWSMLGEAS
ncbi:MAG: tRNA (N6-isopentenyl adenosine(37)-C2)-methylthiotransferase MiaB [Chloroflexi bacterium]|nr:tRNA (N6-isopentenyl adenosine(37)-C2)-methylthiotransferase MiaB [Chloroflexota bacterium]